MTPADIDYFVSEFTASGFRGPINRYRNHTRDFEYMSTIADRTIHQPSLFIVGENDLVLKMFGGSADAAALKQAQDALGRVGLGALAARPTATLGLLDRKRLELARTLATQPTVLLLDEIGGGLTEGELHQLVDLIGTLRDDGLTIVWIEHVLHALLEVHRRRQARGGGENRQKVALGDLRGLDRGDGFHIVVRGAEQDRPQAQEIARNLEIDDLPRATAQDLVGTGPARGDDEGALISLTQ